MDAAERDDIAAMIADRVPADEIARRLILPLNDVLTVVEELRLADTPPPNRTSAVQPPVRRSPVVAVPSQECAPMPSPIDVPPRGEPVAAEPDLFLRADAIDDKRVAKALDAAKKATALLTELVEKHEQTAAVRARIAQLEAELASERDKLKAPKAPDPATPGRPVAALGPDAAVVRAWAHSAGVAVPAKGPIATRVIDAYRAAHPAAASA